MKQFAIQSVDQTIKPKIQAKIDNLNKPKGSLGRLEEMAMQICLIQQSLEPSLFHALKRFFKGNSEAFRIYSVSNLFVITCEDHFSDSNYQVLGLRSLRE